MKKEDKDLLLKDLCGRLIYNIKVHAEHDIGDIKATADLFVYGYDHNKKCLKLLREDNETFCYINIEECKPYLRPMSSMTEEEVKEYNRTLIPLDYYDGNTFETFDWLNAHHFDYRGLIEKGLALEAPEGMYKEDKK